MKNEDEFFYDSNTIAKLSKIESAVLENNIFLIRKKNLFKVNIQNEKFILAVLLLF